MSTELARRIRSEASLAERFAESYKRRFSATIDRMNLPHPAAEDAQSLRLCVEAMDMMLATQIQLARAICEMTTAQAIRPAA